MVMMGGRGRFRDFRLFLMRGISNELMLNPTAILVVRREWIRL
jgi:hypothetical protein